MQSTLLLVTEMTTLLWLLALAIAITAFCLWEYRVYMNLAWLPNATSLRFSPGSAVWWWFVPVANLWQPYRVIQDIWQHVADAGHRKRLLRVWWILWLVAGVAGSFVFVTDLGGYNDLIHAFSHGVHLFAAALAAMIVGRITAWQDNRRRQGAQLV